MIYQLKGIEIEVIQDKLIKKKREKEDTQAAPESLIKEKHVGTYQD